MDFLLKLNGKLSIRIEALLLTFHIFVVVSIYRFYIIDKRRTPTKLGLLKLPFLQCVISNVCLQFYLTLQINFLVFFNSKKKFFDFIFMAPNQRSFDVLYSVTTLDHFTKTIVHYNIAALVRPDP